MRDVLRPSSLVCEVGVIGPKASTPKRAGKGVKNAPNQTLVDIATIHEFGSETRGVYKRNKREEAVGPMRKGRKSFTRSVPGTKGTPYTITIPKRSFIAAWFDEKAGENRVFAQKLAGMRIDGKLTAEKSLQMMGVKATGGMQRRISAGIQPPNADSTIRRKKSSKPLIDTGQLRSSLTSRVVRKVVR
jgi:hypothetical protein